ncbi:hypothetical protein [Ruminococcus flavefaciens]|uniref:Uncharacterized protein n=1 Tax=Ruminococcus flavefaciens 007c TaxID=1341157 RepID=W7UG27_RUMFL|nr:hypothetical protein [Ruminococcus flavefaciens]EWM52908.1 hypothetical protein RF007C_14945 [Ruminococcus flavefaciens 007c]
MTNPNDLARNRNIRAQEFAHNRALMNKCTKRYNTMGILYFVPLLIYIPVTIGFAFITGSFIPFVDALIVCPLLAFLAWRSFYHKHDLMIIFLFIVLFTNQFLLVKLAPYEDAGFFKFRIMGKCSVGHLIILLIIGSVAVLNFITNMTYHKLEEADGFPQFNERFFDQEMDIRQSRIKDPFQAEMERRQRTASDSMADISLPSDLSAKSKDGGPPAGMDCI